MPAWTLLSAALLLAPAADATPSAGALLLARQGMTRLALRRVFDELEERPADPDLQAQAGMMLLRMGAAADAVAAFEDTRGAGAFTQTPPAMSAWADALREAGRADEALALREELVVVTPRRGRLTLFQDMVADALAAGDLPVARDAAQRGLTEFPHAPTLLAWMAEVELAAGDRDAAEGWLALSERDLPQGVRRGRLLRGRLALTDQLYADAREHVMAVRKRSVQDADALALLFAIEQAELGSEAALIVTQSPAWLANQEHPRLQALRALALLGVDERAEARAIGAHLLALYPGRADVQALQIVLSTW